MAAHRRKVPSDPEVKARIRAAMDFHRIRPAQLAKMLSVSPSAVSQWLSGSVTPSDESFRLMAEMLGEDVRWLQGKTVRGKTGVGALVGALVDKLGEDGFELLAALPAPVLRRILADHQNAPRPPRSPHKSPSRHRKSDA